MIIAIDGPAGSGKTTVGRLIAGALGFALVDTGLFYRAITVEARRRGIAVTDVAGLTELARAAVVEVNTSPTASAGASLVRVNGRDVTREAMDPAIATDLSAIARLPQVREVLCDAQRQFHDRDCVVLGRDIGTVIFPDADAKFFFTASATERLKRRREALEQSTGVPASEAVLEAEIDARDRADSEREVAPLRRSADAIIIATEGKTVHQVFQEVMARLPER
ncbi:MAG TPA: (d)CMP kinase [Candidatus Limnocylindrales bacterium]|nr:(d)CMP kinase [Candidatus Limnocylindrales bacterium]